MNRQWQVKQLPNKDAPLSSLFQLSETERPSPREGEFLVATRYFSIDPAMLPWILSVADYMVPQELGQPMLSWATAEIV